MIYKVSSVGGGVGREIDGPRPHKIDRATWAVIKFDMRHIGPSDMRRGITIVEAWDIAFS